jgi:hypothetical protein
MDVHLLEGLEHDIVIIFSTRTALISLSKHSDGLDRRKLIVLPPGTAFHDPFSASGA